MGRRKELQTIMIKYYQYKLKEGNGSIYRAVFHEHELRIEYVEVYKLGQWVRLVDANWVVLGMKKRTRKISKGESYLNYTCIEAPEFA